MLAAFAAGLLADGTKTSQRQSSTRSLPENEKRQTSHVDHCRRSRAEAVRHPHAAHVMQASSADTVREFGTLVAAVRRNKGIDAHLLPSDSTWHELFPALTRRATTVQECLIRQGDGNRNLYFLESGLLRVYRAGPDVRLQLAVLGAGSVVGEGTFFAPIVRNASVEALEPTALWELTPAGFDAFAARNPVAGLQLCRYLGAVLATRMLSVTGRLSIT